MFGTVTNLIASAEYNIPLAQHEQYDAPAAQPSQYYSDPAWSRAGGPLRQQ